MLLMTLKRGSERSARLQLRSIMSMLHCWSFLVAMSAVSRPSTLYHQLSITQLPRKGDFWAAWRPRAPFIPKTCRRSQPAACCRARADNYRRRAQAELAMTVLMMSSASPYLAHLTENCLHLQPSPLGVATTMTLHLLTDVQQKSV